MRYLTLAFIIIFAMLATGCAFASKDVKLNAVGATQPGSQRLSGIDFSVSVKDSRGGAPGIVGATGWSFGNVKTQYDVRKWVGDSLSTEIANAGGKRVNNGSARILCSVNKLEACMGFLSLINSKLAVDVTVANRDSRKALGELTTEYSPFVFFDSNSAYEETITEMLKLWLKQHAPKIIMALSMMKSKPTKKTEPTTEPEHRTQPVKPRLPELTVTSPKSGFRSSSPRVIVSGQVENAAGGELIILVNGIRKGSIFLVTSHEPFSKPVELFAGKNTLELNLKPAKGKSITRKLTATFTPPKLSGIHGLTIGVSRFDNLGTSTYADKAAASVCAVFKSGVTQGSKTQTVNIKSGITVRKTLSEMKRAFGAAKKGESVIIYYCGAVISSNGQLAFAVSKTDPKNPASAVMFTDIALAAERYFRGKRVLIIAQGAAGKSPGKLPEPSLIGESLSVLVYEPSRGNSAAVSDGLGSSADKNRDGYVTVSELRSYLNTKGSTSLYGAIATDFQLTRIK